MVAACGSLKPAIASRCTSGTSWPRWRPLERHHGGAAGTAARRVGVQPAVGRLLTVPIASRVLRELPDVRVHVMEGLSAHILEWLLADRIDRRAALRPAEPQPRELRVRTRTGLVLVGPQEFGMRLEHGARVAPGRSDPHSARQAARSSPDPGRACARSGFALNVPIEIDSAPSISGLVAGPWLHRPAFELDHRRVSRPSGVGELDCEAPRHQHAADDPRLASPADADGATPDADRTPGSATRVVGDVTRGRAPGSAASRSACHSQQAFGIAVEHVVDDVRRKRHAQKRSTVSLKGSAG